MPEQLVFFEQGTAVLTTSANPTALVIVEEPEPAVSTQATDPDVFTIAERAPTSVTESLTPGDALLVSSPAALKVVDFFTGGDVLQVISGGPRGAQGPAGPAAVAYEQSFNFPSAATQWVIDHNQNTKGLSVTTFDINGAVIIGDVEYPNNNTILVNWYFATAGSALIFD